jgi:prephenate dehydrogenase
MAQDVVIAGLGLIGGSLGRALRWAGWHVAFVDPAVSLREAKAAGAADEKLDRLEGDLIVLATPLDVAVKQLKGLRTSRALITSTASAMQPLRAVAKKLRFVAGHPFAGLEQSGLSAGTAGLFFRRLWFVDRDEPEVRRMISDAGARQVVIEAAEHDRNLALGSHLPQVLSTALASLLADVDPMFIGNGARSLLRLAASPWDVWRPVIEQNRDNIRRAAEELCRRMREIDEDDFTRANEFNRGSGARPGR